jgi:hypothetical protein
VLEYCARSELHPRSGLMMLTRRFVLVLESGHAELWSAQYWEYCAKSELHPRSGLGPFRGEMRVASAESFRAGKQAHMNRLRRVGCDSIACELPLNPGATHVSPHLRRWNRRHLSSLAYSGLGCCREPNIRCRFRETLSAPAWESLRADTPRH